MTTFDPETAENNPDIEKQWAVRAFDHAETYFKLLSCIDPSTLKLTPIDDEIYQHFRSDFPASEFPVDKINEELLKSEDAKKKWRPWMMGYEKRVQDYNFGTLLRLDSQLEYTEKNSIFVPRVQFLAIELARNREGLNQGHFTAK